MTILDSQGRLFGKVSILDIGAVLVILLVIVGILFVPGTGKSIGQPGAKTQPVEVDVMVRGLGVLNPETLVVAGEKASFVIRNQPAGSVNIKSVEFLPRSVAVPQPDGSVKAEADPRPELNYTADMLISLDGKAQITNDGPVLGQSKVKVGMLVQLQGLTYDFNATVIDVRIQDN